MILVTGTLGYDNIETFDLKAERILGGAANYSTLSAYFFSPVCVVSCIGKDYTKKDLGVLISKNIDLKGVKITQQKSFTWTGRYGEDLKDAETLDLHLNTMKNFSPKLSEEYKDKKFIFLSNMDPEIQLSILEQMSDPVFTLLDTMSYWIRKEEKKKTLIRLIPHITALILNETEIKELTESQDLKIAIFKTHKLGVETVIIKRGKEGFLLSHKDKTFKKSSYPVKAIDPTGAGDSFAGGFLGAFASSYNESVSFENLKTSCLYGSVLSSFAVEDIGLRSLLKLNLSKIEERLERYKKL